ncbi:hypothetical protein D0T12_09105 [Actinomadura spongiicola]|uniref:SecDF P1 head subdomain domain-containing protein n=1 Tax=Actinomadura spongiicola TaxID=2303421 RepID=A0A372GIL7_9ACTN|nr:hypothetical protein [Actinomadura spongiicola]RFS85211.1 hypothetical protein D0T12_09105 [Actinomadura spongiicola]
MVAFAVLVPLALVLAGLAIILVVDASRGGDDREGVDAGPAVLREPVTFQQVAETSTAPCASGTVPDVEGTACYRLGADRMTIGRVRSIRAVYDGASGQTGWSVELKLTTADAAAFGRLTGKVAAQPEGSPTRQIAVVVGGKVISAPSVQAPIPGGAVMISGAFDRAKAETFVKRMTGNGNP